MRQKAFEEMHAYTTGKRVLTALPAGLDITAAIDSLCTQKGIDRAAFSIIGSVSCATIGVFDPKQQVFVTHVEQEATEIVSCIGNTRIINGDRSVTAKLILANQQGGLTGGHLFSETLVAQADIDLQELLARP